jgi:hypothetical protein
VDGLAENFYLGVLKAIRMSSEGGIISHFHPFAASNSY